MIEFRREEMVSYLVKDRFVYTKDGQLIARIECSEGCDQNSQTFFKLKDNDITNMTCIYQRGGKII